MGPFVVGRQSAGDIGLPRQVEVSRLALVGSEAAPDDRVLAEHYGLPGVSTSVDDQLTHAAAAIAEADRALGELRQLDGHDAQLVAALGARADVLRDAVTNCHEAVKAAGAELYDARYRLNGLEPVTGARLDVHAAAATLHVVRPSAAAAVTDSAELAARAGLNPTPPADQRHVVPSSEREGRPRPGDTRATERESG
jgi:hypothetical protein